MIIVEDLHKFYGAKAVLQGMSFEAPAGQITLLVGPNGAGKTTTLKSLVGLCLPNRGNIWINGCKLPYGNCKALSQLSYLPQRIDFHPRLKVGQVMEFYARLRGIPLSICKLKLNRFGLDESWDQRVGTLSGGMKQRLGLAVLLLPDSPILLLDEPGLSLDPEWRHQLKLLLLHESGLGKTVLMATHLLGEWEGVAHQCLMCNHGRVETELDPDNIQSSYRNWSRNSASQPFVLSGLPVAASQTIEPIYPLS